MTVAEQPSERDEHYNEEETAQRREAALKRMLSTPPKPHKHDGEKPKRDRDNPE